MAALGADLDVDDEEPEWLQASGDTGAGFDMARNAPLSGIDGVECQNLGIVPLS